MENTENVKSRLSQDDSIQTKFIESLVTGQRNPIFEKKTTPLREPEEEAHRVYIDSQRGTF